MVIGGRPDSARDCGKVGIITAMCLCQVSFLCASLLRIPFYRIESLGACYREDVLKKIEGDGRRVETPETRDAPVAA